MAPHPPRRGGPRRDPDPDGALRASVLDYLARHSVLALATAGPAGPWAAAVFYVNEGLTLYFLSSPRSRHARNLAAGGRAAGAIHEDSADWRAVKGIQLEGRVAPVPRRAIDRIRALYAAKFPVIAGGTPPAVAAALATVRWYALAPEALHFVDNAAGFGKRRRLL